jgi:hypothetical protein
MAQPVDEPSLRDDLHPRADARHAGADPHETEIAIVKGFEDSAERRGLDLVGCGHSSGLYLRTRQGQQESDAPQKRTVPFFFSSPERRRPDGYGGGVWPPRHLPALLPIHDELTVWPGLAIFHWFRSVFAPVDARCGSPVRRRCALFQLESLRSNGTTKLWPAGRTRRRAALEDHAIRMTPVSPKMRSSTAVSPGTAPPPASFHRRLTTSMLGAPSNLG